MGGGDDKKVGWRGDVEAEVGTIQAKSADGVGSAGCEWHPVGGGHPWPSPHPVTGWALPGGVSGLLDLDRLPLPTTLVIDGEGRIQGVVQGVLEQGDGQWR